MSKVDHKLSLHGKKLLLKELDTQVSLDGNMGTLQTEVLLTQIHQPLTEHTLLQVLFLEHHTVSL